jgi:hypothetical protein
MSDNTTTIENETGAVVAAQEREAQALLEVAQAYEIDSPDMAAAAAEELGAIKAKAKQLDELRKSMTRPLDEANARIMDLFRGPQDLLAKAEMTIKGAIGKWQQLANQRAEEARRAAEAVARAERERLDAERKAAEEAARQAAADGDESAAAEAQAKAVVLAAEAEVVEHLAPAVVEAPQKLAGVSTRKDWDFEIVDPAAIPREYLAIDEKKIRAYVKAMKSDAKIPGVRVYAKDVIAARATK